MYKVNYHHAIPLLIDVSNCHLIILQSLTAFGLSIYLIVRVRKDSKRLFITLEESNKTIFQMKDAMDTPFKRLQLNMDNVPIEKSYNLKKSPV